jgi:hypothetical protein
MRERDLRTQLQRRLGARFSAALWDLLEDLGFVAEVLEFGAMNLDQLEDQARRILTAGTSSADHRVPAPAPREPRLGQERAWALSQLVAAHAHHDPDILAFRHKYLGDALVEWADLDTWIMGQAKLDGEPTIDVTIALLASALSDPDADELHLRPPLERVHPARVATRRLDHALPGDNWVRRVAVTADGMLDRLRILAEALAKAYSWTPAQASIFVLCGVTPFVATVRITRSSAKVRHHADLDWARRITLDIDPAATPQQVLDAFQQARRQQGVAQLRPLTLKHLRLAAFAGAEHADKPWAERLRLWNTSFPEWHYPEQSNFRRDAIRAEARILYPGQYRGSTPLRERGNNEPTEGSRGGSDRP